MNRRVAAQKGAPEPVNTMASSSAERGKYSLRSRATGGVTLVRAGEASATWRYQVIPNLLIDAPHRAQ